MPGRIAILGWGSLLWDQQPDFDNEHGAWNPGGPRLLLEFSRISASRNGALTLVIDSVHGAKCQVSFTLSSRAAPEEAIRDLAKREGFQSTDVIGILQKDSSLCRGRDAQSIDAIYEWLKVQSDVDAVIWTDLPSNFEKKYKKPFDVKTAIEYFHSLSPLSKRKAVEYLLKAPAFVNTPLRLAFPTEYLSNEC